MAVNYWTEIQQSLALQRAIAGSTGTTARSIHKFDSLGMGSYRLTTPLTFRVKFIEEPLVTTGVAMVEGSAIPSAGYEPTATVGVWKWVKEGNLYTGAYVWFGVSQAVTTALRQYETQEVATAKKLHLRHHLSFEAYAIRDVDYDAIMRD